MPAQTRSGTNRSPRSSTQLNSSKATRKGATVGRASSSGAHGGATVESAGNRVTRRRTRHEGIQSETSSVQTPGWVTPGASTRSAMTIPTEVFIEIAKYLHPIDLAHLARVNKFLRDVFMSRRAATLWRSALLGVEELPPCPGSINEPQYVSMIFTRTCSNCGRGAPRDMDPFLLVRLCAQCRNKRVLDTSKVPDSTLVVSSSNVVPGKNSGVKWCLRDDAEAVQLKLDELNAAKDTAAKELWEKERRAEVNQRHEDANILKLWLDKREHAAQEEMERIRGKRQAKIKSRLLRLGWEAQDFCPQDPKRRKKWNAMVYNAKPLTDQTWANILPHLLKHLTMNREQRLKREKTVKDRQERFTKLLEWLRGKVKDQSTGFARATPANQPPTSTIAPDSCWASVKYNGLALSLPFPSTYDMARWPELQILVEQDIPVETFTARLDEEQEALKTLITGWRTELESSITKLLPSNTSAPKFDIPSLKLTVGDEQPITSLLLDTQKLLRADAIFMGFQGMFYYPDDFVGSELKASDIKYYSEASKIAQGLLKVLGAPDASYLELKAMGNVFQCGRCHSSPTYMNWKNMVKHYLDKASQWQHWHGTGTRYDDKARDFTYIFTHGVDEANCSKPLVRIVEESKKVPPRYGTPKKCIVCSHAKISRWYDGDHVIDHLRDVHLIETPEEDKHFGLH